MWPAIRLLKLTPGLAVRSSSAEILCCALIFDNVFQGVWVCVIGFVLPLGRTPDFLDELIRPPKPLPILCLPPRGSEPQTLRQYGFGSSFLVTFDEKISHPTIHDVLHIAGSARAGSSKRKNPDQQGQKATFGLALCVCWAKGSAGRMVTRHKEIAMFQPANKSCHIIALCQAL